MNCTKPSEEQQRDYAERNDRGNDLVLRQNGCETADRKIKHSKQAKASDTRRRYAPVELAAAWWVIFGKCRSKAASGSREDVEKDSAKKFREHNLPVAHRRCHERLDGAELKFFGKQAHRDQRENENEREPEKRRN